MNEMSSSYFCCNFKELHIF